MQELRPRGPIHQRLGPGVHARRPADGHQVADPRERTPGPADAVVARVVVEEALHDRDVRGRIRLGVGVVHEHHGDVVLHPPLGRVRQQVLREADQRAGRGQVEGDLGLVAAACEAG